MKFLLIVRDPVDRLHSDYNFMVINFLFKEKYVLNMF